MENETENKIGTVKTYDGFTGVIASNDEDFIFNKKDIEDVDFTKLQNGDTVEFSENIVSFGDEKIKVARFVKCLKQKKN